MYKVALLALLCAFSSLSYASLEGGGVMLIARRNMMCGWTNPYVTDGLIAMWDGEWNAGGGVHDSNATVWKDLSGNGRDWTMLSGAYRWYDHALRVDGRAAKQATLPKCYTIEMVQKTESGRWILVGYGIGNGNPGVIQGICTINTLTGFQTSFTYPTATETKWIKADARTLCSFSTVYEDFNSQSTRLFKGYLGGVELEQYEGGSNYWQNTKGESYIGALGKNAMITPSWNWNGEIYSIRMYSKQLTATEIAANYAIDKARFGLA